jgi:hypothetical protein
LRRRRRCRFLFLAQPDLEQAPLQEAARLVTMRQLSVLALSVADFLRPAGAPQFALFASQRSLKQVLRNVEATGQDRSTPLPPGESAYAAKTPAHIGFGRRIAPHLSAVLLNPVQ